MNRAVNEPETTMRRASLGALLLFSAGCAGKGVGKGSDDTLFATQPGVVSYHESRGRRYASVQAR